ncbi:MAG TPA: VWA domain-containing protein [Dactylosporangium sp.]|nr:VWA domain-containing protein [Dactylosporangium sp.]
MEAVLSEELVDFARRLRAAGMRVEPPRLAAAAEALGLRPWAGEPDPYWALRLTLCGRRSDLDVFDAVYHGRSAAPDEHPPAAEHGEDGDADEGEAPAARDPDTPAAGAAGADYVAELATRALHTLDDAERAAVAALIARLAPAARARPAPHRVPARAGRVDRGRTVRLMIRSGGEIVRLPRRRRGRTPRRLLFLIDVSLSMSAYADALLLFAHAAVAAGPRSTEVFVVGTGWTRVTAALRARDPQAAMRSIAAVEADWDQGTRLGHSLESFLRRYAGHRTARAAVVVIGSDGQDEDSDPGRMPRQVARLSRVAHRIVWVLPAARRGGYRPRRPLRESLRHADERFTGHTLEQLRGLAEAIAR